MKQLSQCNSLIGRSGYSQKIDPLDMDALIHDHARGEE
jgi:hypothetical protein